MFSSQIFVAFLVILAQVSILVIGLTEDEIVPCYDEELDCAERVKNGSCLGLNKTPNGTKFSLAIGSRFLSRCRVSCRKHLDWQREQGLLNESYARIIDKFGGTGDVIETLFGSKISLCDLRKGWTAQARGTLIDRRYSAVTTITSKRHGPRRHTEVGFEKTRVPAHIWKEIKRLHFMVGKKWKPEPCQSPGIYNCQDIEENNEECKIERKITSMTGQVGEQFENFLGRALLPLAEEWIGGVKLVFNNAYGFRRYLKGGKCEGHVDTYEERVISAIINVAQDVDGHPWPLNIMDHNGTHHRVFMEPGDLVWYESAKMPHGREELFQGNYFDNIFVHFKPAWYENATNYQMRYPYEHNMGKTRFDE